MAGKDMKEKKQDNSLYMKMYMKAMGIRSPKESKDKSKEMPLKTGKNGMALYVPTDKTEKKPPLGSGERFEKLSAELESKGVKNPKGLAAWIGRKKFGKERFQKLAATGKKRAASEKV